MTAYLVFVATLVSIRVLTTRGIEQAMLKVWIPFFLAMPFSFWVNIPGLPDPNFMQAAILPILFFLVRDNLTEMQFGRMERLLLLYVLVRVFCDFLGRGYSDAQNYAFYMLSSLIGPYLLGRYVIDSRRMDIETGRMFVLMFLCFFRCSCSKPSSGSARFSNSSVHFFRPGSAACRSGGAWRAPPAPSNTRSWPAS